MSDVLNDSPAVQTPERKPIFRITPENAREMAARSAEARRAVKIAHLNPAPEPVQAEPSLHARAIEELLEEIAIINKAFRKAETAAEYRDLTMAKERLFKQWTHLAGIAGPGNFKPRSARSRQTSIPEPIPLPEPNQAAG